MRLIEFQKLSEEDPAKKEVGERFLAGEKMIVQKVNAGEGDMVTMFVVTAVKKKGDKVVSYEFAPEYIKIEK